MKLRILLSLMVILTCLAASDHPIYVSTAEIDYKTKERRIEMAVKIFSNDLQSAISAKEGNRVEIGTKQEEAAIATKYIKEYLHENFKLYSNDKELEWEYVGRELDRQDDFAIWVFLKVEKVRKLKDLVLYNNILIEHQEGQKNKISFRTDSEQYRKFDTYLDAEKVKLF